MGAIGRWIDQIHEATEDAILTRKMIPFNVDDGYGAGCIIGQANFVHDMHDAARTPFREWNALCMRLAGIFSRQECTQMVQRTHYPTHDLSHPACYVAGAQAAQLLRIRILRNRAKRALTAVPHHVFEEASCLCSQ